MKGRRLPLGTWPTEPGDYMGPISGYTGDVPMVIYVLPNGERGHVVSPPHQFRECADGSLEIRASIGARTWHGWLDEGHQWRA